MALIKTAAEILKGRPRPVDYAPGRRNKGGRPRLHRGCLLAIKGCKRPHWGHGYCRPHGRKFMLYGDPEWVRGTVVTCLCVRCPVHQPTNTAFSRPHRYRSTARSHGGRRPRYTHCQVPGCTRPHHGKGMCKGCGRKAARWGDPLHVYIPARSGRCGCLKHREK